MTGRLQRLPAYWLRPLGALVLLLAVILVAYWHTAWSMAMIWARSDTYAHGFVVPIISLWLVWRQRAVLAPMVPRPGRLAWLLMAGATALWLAGDLVAVNAATQLALITLIVLSVPAVLGWRVAKALAFPLAFLFFAVPIGDFLLPRLMEWTADFTVMALRASGIPVYREGLQFIIPSGTWSVVEACSGIRYLIASVTVGCLFAYLSYQSTRKRMVFIGVAILVPLVANWMRAYMIVMLGHYSGNTIATGVDHLVYGWLFFGIVIGVMFLIGARWVDPLPPPSKKVIPGDSTAENAPIRTPWLALALVFFVVLAPHGALAVMDFGTQTRPVQVVEPMVAAPWHATSTPPSTWRPAFEYASDTLDAGLIDGQSQPLGLHVSYYRQQNYQRKLVSSEKRAGQKPRPNLDAGGQWFCRCAAAGPFPAYGHRRAASASAHAQHGQRRPAPVGVALLLGSWRLHRQRLRGQDTRCSGPHQRVGRRRGAHCDLHTVVGHQGV